MSNAYRRPLAAFAATAVTFSLVACSNDGENTETEQTADTITIVDSTGEEKTVNVPPQRVVATDNGSFQTLDDWGIEIVGGSRALMSEDISYESNEDIVDLGSHNEPDLEAVVANDPDLIITGSRFSQYTEDFERLVPDATVLDLRYDSEGNFDEELINQTEILGEIFGKEVEAAELVDDFRASIDRVKDAYNPDATVMAVITSGGNINYAAPSEGRTLGPIFDILDLTPSLEQDGSTDHQGDEVSVETIAESNPDFIMVMDRDAGVSSADGTPANELLAESAALQNVTAVQEGNIVYMPSNIYVNENIQNYTIYFNALADAFEAYDAEQGGADDQDDAEADES